ncbi:hypothetical protein PYCC9005_001150 [Savitreella phatthalungensis]
MNWHDSLHGNLKANISGKHAQANDVQRPRPRMTRSESVLPVKVRALTPGLPSTSASATPGTNTRESSGDETPPLSITPRVKSSLQAGKSQRSASTRVGPESSPRLVKSLSARQVATTHSSAASQAPNRPDKLTRSRSSAAVIVQTDPQALPTGNTMPLVPRAQQNKGSHATPVLRARASSSNLVSSGVGSAGSRSRTRTVTSSQGSDGSTSVGEPRPSSRLTQRLSTALSPNTSDIEHASSAGPRPGPRMKTMRRLPSESTISNGVSPASPAKEFPGAVMAVSPIASPVKEFPSSGVHTGIDSPTRKRHPLQPPQLSRQPSRVELTSPRLGSETSDSSSTVFSIPHPQTNSLSREPHQPEDEAVVHTTAQNARKLADLEIRNASLMAVNASLERRTRRWAKEIADLRRCGPSSGGQPTSTAILPDDLVNEENPDDHHPSIPLDAAIDRALVLADHLVRAAEEGLAWRPKIHEDAIARATEGVRRVVSRDRRMNEDDGDSTVDHSHITNPEDITFDDDPPANHLAP